VYPGRAAGGRRGLRERHRGRRRHQREPEGLNEYCQSAGNDGGLAGCGSADANLTWTWDDIAWTGANTGDGCALYDTDDDGKANFALCTSVTGDPAAQEAGSPKFYSCDDTKVLNCGGATVQASATSSCAVTSVSDPFSGDHAAGNVCSGTNCTTSTPRRSAA
jgi:hypothetical protein